LATHEYKVIALRDLGKYAGTDIEPTDPLTVIQDRKKVLQEK
jgi:hypothetical protein